MIEVLKQMYQLLLTEPHAPAVCDQLEVILRQAIAELESQKPVAWISPKGHIHFDPYLDSVPLYTHPPQSTERKPIAMLFGSLPVYDTPSQRTWVGLTKEDKDLIEDLCEMMIGDAAFSTIDAILKGKNT